MGVAFLVGVVATLLCVAIIAYVRSRRVQQTKPSTDDDAKRQDSVGNKQTMSTTTPPANFKIKSSDREEVQGWGFGSDAPDENSYAEPLVLSPHRDGEEVNFVYANASSDPRASKQDTPTELAPSGSLVDANASSAPARDQLMPAVRDSKAKEAEPDGFGEITYESVDLPEHAGDPRQVRQRVETGESSYLDLAEEMPENGANAAAREHTWDPSLYSVPSLKQTVI